MWSEIFFDEGRFGGHRSGEYSRGRRFWRILFLGGRFFPLRLIGGESCLCLLALPYGRATQRQAYTCGEISQDEATR